MDTAFLEFLFRWGHVLFGVVWIGLLYYFNFVQTEYFKEAEATAKADALQKLAPRALWYFRWGAMLTFLTGLMLLHFKAGSSTNWGLISIDITLGATMGILMFLNVWLVIWPKQKIVIAGGEGVAEAAAKASLASRTNTLFSLPMLYFMVSSAHQIQGGLYATKFSSMALVAGLAIVAAIELNALFGKPFFIASVRGVIHASIGLTIIMALLVNFL